MVRTKEVVKKVDERKIAKKLDVSRTPLWTIVKNDVKLKSYNKQKVHGLTEA
jgi:DNA-directed RNA polymerase subunit H (RpoH/RPB5)